MFLATFLFLTFKFEPLKAFATNDPYLDVAVKYITENDAIEYNSLPLSRLKKAQDLRYKLEIMPFH